MKVRDVVLKKDKSGSEAGRKSIHYFFNLSKLISDCQYPHSCLQVLSLWIIEHK